MTTTFLITLISAGSVIATYFSESSHSVKKDKMGKEAKKTYEYWLHLSYEQQEEYFDNNYILNDYKDELLYDNRERTAQYVAELSEKLGKEFSNRYKSN